MAKKNNRVRENSSWKVAVSTERERYVKTEACFKNEMVNALRYSKRSSKIKTEKS